MMMMKVFSLAIVLFFLLSFLSSASNTQHYIVYMGGTSLGKDESYIQKQLLEDVVGSNVAGASKLLHSFQRSFSGFVAELTEDEAATIAARDEVVSVFPDREMELHTTRSWDFLGLTATAKRSTAESDIIVGVLDTGVWPESQSFSDHDIGPAPPKWKGICQSSPHFSCKNKIIGARFYSIGKSSFGKTDIPSPRDTLGHGSHTASTAAGATTTASLFDLASGTARGAVPSARLAIYKVCWGSGKCNEADILAAFDDAIADGVDIISISIGGGISFESAKPYFRDSIAIGAFHGMRKGVLTCASSGNDGPGFGSVQNAAPWLLTVAASTLDRKFVTNVQLGNNTTFEGVSLDSFDLHNKKYPLVRARDAESPDLPFPSGFCMPGSLNPEIVQGTIVLCDYATNNGAGPLEADAIGYIAIEDGCNAEYGSVTPLPASCISAADGARVYSFINHTSKPTATIMKSVGRLDPAAPVVVSFSSRGPNTLNPDILKPDITAPGVNILAAWSGVAPVSSVKGDKRLSAYNIRSGTSMACPHVSGVAAYVKEFNPSWSPAAIKSAIMTTASKMKPKNSLGAELAYGSGQVNPVKAVDPGLVYDLTDTDYISFLCSHGYKTQTLRLLTRDRTSCEDEKVANKVSKNEDLNYPSMALGTNSSSFRATFRRTVTNMGTGRSTYTVKVTGGPSLTLVVEPKVLAFECTGQKRHFSVKVEGSFDMESRSPLGGSIVWHDGVHEVRSPIVIFSLSEI